MDSVRQDQISIIVFSKGRPMQMHAYLESLFLFSDARQEMVTVLYCETEQIRYGKLMQRFSQVTWVRENKFETDLKQILSGAGEYIMFGCDDVVFTRRFSLQRAGCYLAENAQVFGYSMRLGENIKPAPQNLSSDDTVFEWQWDCACQHYDYPWELDCTLYRKEDVVRMTMEEETAIKNPNFYEAMITPDNRKERITRPNMASGRQSGCAVVITVNRVQETHQNGFDDSMRTDIYSLDKLYNDEDNTLDIERIASMDNSVIHVGAEYFILRKETKGYAPDSLKIKKRKIKELADKLTRFPKRVHRHFERKSYEKGRYADKLNILDTDETLALMEREKISFLRYGDGEIAIMQGNSIPFQEYDPRLAKRLRKLLRTDTDGLKIGIPYYYMHPVRQLNDFTAKFAKALAVQRRFLCKNCSRDMVYVDTCITQVYQTYEKYDFKKYYRRMQKLLGDRHVTIVCGEGVFDRLEYKAYDACKSVEFVTAPSMNAFADYDSLLRKVLKTSSERLVCIVLGPTAKILACDLHKKGYQAWDMGHYFKDYDAYMRKKPRTAAEIAQFYKPD
ncbi:MAG: DUF1792 domain-containing protein [Lachnospiraceae bacterium]|nr:DUF1792 domain-containing protein [Lachnospiraceae bacterium]